MKLKRGKSVQQPTRHYRKVVVSLVAIGIGAALLLAWRGWVRPGPPEAPPPLPANLDQLEPDVAQLIRAKAQAAQASPRDAAAYGELGLVYEANRLWNDARQAYARAARLKPDDAGWQLHLAMAAQEVGDFPAALATLLTLADTHPALAPAQQRLGYALLETGQWDQARRAFERVIELEPKAAEGYVGLGSHWLRQGDAAQAAGVLEKALQLAPEYPVAHHLLGTAYGQLGREQEAAKHLALGLDATVRYLPDPLTLRLAEYAVNVKSLVSTGGRQLADGRIDQAIQTLERVLRAEPDNVSAMNNLAVAYVRQQRFDDAHQILLKAQQIDPNKYLTYINLANWAKVTGDFNQALQYADRAIELAPQVDITHRTRAAYLAQAGRIDQALVDASRAATLNPRDARTQLLCGDLCMRLRRFTEAEGYFRAATELSAQHAPAWLGLAQASLEAGNVDEAVRALERARQLAPNDPQVRRMRERLEARGTPAPLPNR